MFLSRKRVRVYKYMYVCMYMYGGGGRGRERERKYMSRRKSKVMILKYSNIGSFLIFLSSHSILFSKKNNRPVNN